MDLFDSSIAFGLTPFETVYFQDKTPQRLENHYRRLLRASRVLNVLYNYDFEKFKKGINDFIKESNEENGVLKAILLNGELKFKIRKPSYTKEGFNNGISLYVSSVKRDPKSIFTYFKTLNYGENVLEDIRSKKRGYDGCLFLNYNNQVCETSYANIFFRKDNVIYTPSLTCGILPGIMREDIIKFARDNGYEVKKTKLMLDDIKLMDEAFISNSVSAIYPIKRIDNIEFTSREFVNKIIREKAFNRPWNS
ncbi:aminotransferase class IV [Clostridium cylindrosporum]|uniref:Aminotransferase, class IV n=1 Tax=Clostridium cylindrosporum DSM 605 TaxID=1121307 RepID=A0A0J8D636_CLOCY|nr:aminotransferase class IV [Clostridium cylindrosporum]KMT21317.1 aminotransferase, class IV [Clostridium cylindrosporum DSM 605]